MKKRLLLILLCIATASNAQNPIISDSYSDYVMPEILYGLTAEPNDSFPPVRNQTGFLLSFGTYHGLIDEESAFRLNYPRTGFTFGVSDYGNWDQVGQSFSALTFIEFDFFRKRRKDLKMNVSLGASYFNKRLTRKGKEVNKGVSTGVNWSFKVFMHYELFKHKKTAVRLGVGYFHHSNGHTRLENQGFNSFLVSLSTQIHERDIQNYKPPDSILNRKRERTGQMYMQLRSGIGQNVLSKEFNNRKEVYSVALSIGQITNKTYKFGGGVFYRFYEHYYDYIVNEEALITELYPYFTDAPFSYASSFGVFGEVELLLNHVALEFNLGFNIYQPFYKIDYQINQGVTYYIITGEGPVFLEELGELNQKFEKKRSVSSRLGLRYYLIGNNNAPRHNIFVSVTLNANLGQADFSELSIGYVHGFKLKARK
jgi:hypothetical protein